MACIAKLFRIRVGIIPKHSDAEWALLSQSFQIINKEDELVDDPYIDQFENHSDNYVTLESPEKVSLRLRLADHLTSKNHLNTPANPKKIIYL